MLASGLLLAGFTATVVIAAISSADEPPSGVVSALLLILGGLLQLGSAYFFARSGKPDSTHAKASVRRIVDLARRSEDLSRFAEAARTLSPSEMRLALVDISARLNYVAHDAFASVEDWTSFNPDARHKVEELNAQAADAVARSADDDKKGEQ